MLLFVGETPKNTTDSQYAYGLLETQYLALTQEHTFPPMKRNAMGKPFFSPAPTNGYGYFNISHSKGKSVPFPQNTEANRDSSKGFVAVALGNCPVGVDIQIHKTPSLPLLQRVCSPQERQWLSGGNAAFSLLWTMKEAYVKCKGDGIGTGRSLAQLALPLPKEGQERQILSCPPYTFYLWSHSDYSLGLCLLGDESTTIIDLDHTNGYGPWLSPP